MSRERIEDFAKKCNEVLRAKNPEDAVKIYDSLKKLYDDLQNSGQIEKGTEFLYTNRLNLSRDHVSELLAQTFRGLSKMDPQAQKKLMELAKSMQPVSPSQDSSKQKIPKSEEGVKWMPKTELNLTTPKEGAGSEKNTPTLSPIVMRGRR